MGKLDLSGERFGRLLILGEATPAPSGQRKWFCECDCGKEKTVFQSALRSGLTESCGCLQKERARRAKTTHGKWGTPEHRIWLGMIVRCTNPNSKMFPRYGGRGITVCERWRKFENFLADMGPKPSRKHSIDRRDNEKGYEPGNCRWALRLTQANNTRRNRQVILAGETMSLADARRKTGEAVPYQTVHNRLARGWSIEEALTKPSAPSF